MDPEIGSCLMRYCGHLPTGNRYEEPAFEYRGRDGVVIIGDSVIARLLLTEPGQAFFGMFQKNILRQTPYAQLDCRHLFADLDVDLLEVAISGLSLCYGNNVLGIRQIAVSNDVLIYKEGKDLYCFLLLCFLYFGFLLVFDSICSRGGWRRLRLTGRRLSPSSCLD